MLQSRDSLGKISPHSPFQFLWKWGGPTNPPWAFDPCDVSYLAVAMWREEEKLQRGYNETDYLEAIALTLYTLRSVCIFSILFSAHFLRYWQGEFV